MAQITIEELNIGNDKYPGILNETTKDFLLHGCPADYTEQTWQEMLIVKYTLIAAEQMKKKGRLYIGNDRYGATFCCQLTEPEYIPGKVGAVKKVPKREKQARRILSAFFKKRRNLLLQFAKEKVTAQ